MPRADRPFALDRTQGWKHYLMASGGPIIWLRRCGRLDEGGISKTRTMRLVEQTRLGPWVVVLAERKRVLLPLHVLSLEPAADFFPRSA